MPEKPDCFCSKLCDSSRTFWPAVMSTLPPTAFRLTSPEPTTALLRTVRSLPACTRTELPETELPAPTSRCIASLDEADLDDNALPLALDTERELSCTSRASARVTLRSATMVTPPALVDAPDLVPVGSTRPTVMCSGLPAAEAVDVLSCCAVPAVTDDPMKVTFPLPSVRACPPAFAFTAAKVASRPAVKVVPATVSS
ncbi:hypothetical protein GO300_05182 [Ralstonia solanacearum]|nr:hypothetical protein [Ralstonia solanacearum]